MRLRNCTALICLLLPAISYAQSYRHESFYREAIRTLSSDEFGGRSPMGPYESLTIDYIAERFREMGVLPGVGDSYFQPVRMLSTTSRAENGMVRVTTPGGNLDLSVGEDLLIWTNRAVTSVDLRNLEYVFCGFGICAPEYGWDDFDGLDVRGKVVVAMAGDPGLYDSTLFRARNVTYYSRYSYKFEEASRRGAAGVLVVHDTEACSYGWQVPVASHSGTEMDIDSGDGNMDDVMFKGWLSNAAARELLTRCGFGFDQIVLRSRRPGFRAFLLGASGDVRLSVEYETGLSHNVIGIITGCDPQLRDEYVVYTAHWDHLGTGAPVEGDAIYNGAEDNASGVASLLTIARMFLESQVRPRRTVVLIADTAEEAGLLGTQYYCEHPVFPLERTAVNINIDGTAPREATHDVFLRAPGMSEVDTYLYMAANAQGRYVAPVTDDPAAIFYRCDHLHFVRHGVPALFAGCGSDYVDKERHESLPRRDVYHQPSDEYSEDWITDGSFQDMDMFYAVGLMIANAPDMPEWLPGSDFSR